MRETSIRSVASVCPSVSVSAWNSLTAAGRIFGKEVTSRINNNNNNNNYYYYYYY